MRVYEWENQVLDKVKAINHEVTEEVFVLDIITSQPQQLSSQFIYDLQIPEQFNNVKNCV